jgi:hypothetical protein
MCLLFSDVGELAKQELLPEKLQILMGFQQRQRLLVDDVGSVIQFLVPPDREILPNLFEAPRTKTIDRRVVTWYTGDVGISGADSHI